jgi:hypothetical protein
MPYYCMEIEDEVNSKQTDASPKGECVPRGDEKP